MSQPGRQNSKELWVLCFLLGIVMLNYPFLHIFNKLVTLFGIPLLLLYFLLGWPASILVIYLFTRQIDFDESDSDNGGKS